MHLNDLCLYYYIYMGLGVQEEDFVKLKSVTAYITVIVIDSVIPQVLLHVEEIRCSEFGELCPMECSGWMGS